MELRGLRFGDLPSGAWQVGSRLGMAVSLVGQNGAFHKFDSPGVP